ncbi:hypothetical protein QAD02_011977 [Eretmocerus hayati]|uniref:Uncharacterized protein n=1 Tax=Eretmocerus hayati TaxID=131215 RepID=A0ACC2NYE8_9HYME|nr:hypothetical protein QAD02_011977 [Eretmocerus hayati]
MSGDQGLLKSLDGAITQDEEILIQQICALPNIEMTVSGKITGGAVSGQITGGQRSEVSQLCGNEVARETDIRDDVNDDHDRRVQETMRELASYDGRGHPRNTESSTAPRYKLLEGQESISDNTLNSMNTTDVIQYYGYATSSDYMINELNNETGTSRLPCYNENNIWRSTQLSMGNESPINAPMNQCEYNIKEKNGEYRNEATSYYAGSYYVTSSGHMFNLYGNMETSGKQNIRRNAPK